MSRLILDCDGVLADFVGHMLTELRARGLVVPDEVDDYDFLRGFGENIGAVARDLLKDPNHWMSIPPYERVQDFVEKIRSAGFDIVVATSPWLSCHTWETVRRAWLKRYFDLHHKHVIVGSRKELLRADCFIDDRIEAVISWAEENGARRAGDFPRAFLMLRSYTLKDPHPKFSWSHDDVDRLLDFLAMRAT